MKQACFPRIPEGQGIPLVIQDTTGRDWEFHFRFWQNSNSKMYVLDGIKDYMVFMEWQAGDTGNLHNSPCEKAWESN